jgi:hypothetical protein
MGATTLHIMTSFITTLIILTLCTILNGVSDCLIVVLLSVYNTVCHRDECSYDECHEAECHCVLCSVPLWSQGFSVLWLMSLCWVSLCLEVNIYCEPLCLVFNTLCVLRLSIIMLSVIIAEYHYAQCHHSDCHYAWRSILHRVPWTWVSIFLMVNTMCVTRLSGVMLNVIIWSVIKPDGQ